MDFYCLVPTENQHFRESIDNTKAELVRQPIEKTLMKCRYIEKALINMAVNHTLTYVESTGQIVGDPMEIKLFEFGEFEVKKVEERVTDNLFTFDSKRGDHGASYRQFDFDSQLFRMSTIAKSTLTNNEFYIYTKGSP